MQILPAQIREARDAFAEAPDERARMGRISGAMWLTAAAIGGGAAFLPGAQHQPIGWVLALSAFVFLYGLGSVTGIIPWDRATMRALGIGMAVTIPVAGLAIYLSGSSLSYIEPLLVLPLLYAAFFFPKRWAWPLSIELILIAGMPLLTDPNAIANAFLPRYAALVAGFLAATWLMVGLKERLVIAEMRQREMANSDPLTGVGNRRSFDATMQRELAARRLPRGGRREADRRSLAVLSLDLDDFKGVNDAHGHPVGDAVLCATADSALSILRSSDTLARIGGDEFAVVAPGAGGDAARRMTASIRLAVRAGRGRDLPTASASVGWAVFPDDGEDFETLLRSADERMLRSKRTDGGDRSHSGPDRDADCERPAVGDGGAAADRLAAARRAPSGGGFPSQRLTEEPVAGQT
jgi:diguanylate cyclase (GGDEF)-like protein